jgi:hypothetical protein
MHALHRSYSILSSSAAVLKAIVTVLIPIESVGSQSLARGALIIRLCHARNPAFDFPHWALIEIEYASSD